MEQAGGAFDTCQSDLNQSPDHRRVWSCPVQIWCAFLLQPRSRLPGASQLPPGWVAPPLTRFRCSSRNLRSLCSRFCAASSSGAKGLFSPPSAATCCHTRLQARHLPTATAQAWARHPGFPGSRTQIRPMSPRPGVSQTNTYAKPVVLTTTSASAAITAFFLLPSTTLITSGGRESRPPAWRQVFSPFSGRG